MPKSKTPSQKDMFVSIVVLTDPKTKHVAKEVRTLAKLLPQHYTNYEIIIIDNRLPHKELAAVSALLADTACVRVVRLSRHYGKDVCAYAGIESAIGDIVVVRGSSDPIRLIPDFIESASKHDLVFGVSTRKTRSGVINHYGAKLFYWYNKKFLDISIPENSTLFMALSRRAVNSLTHTSRYARHIRYLARQIGYDSKEVYYEPSKAYKPEKKHIRELAISAIELATNYSKHPLRFLAWLGFSASLFNLLYAGYVIGVNLLKRRVAEGWTTLSLQSAGMFFLMFAILAIMCEYLGKILEETRHEPQYHILDELTSKISVADISKRNIIS